MNRGAVALAILLLVGCGSGADTPVTGPTGPASPGGSPTPEVVTPSPGMAGVHPVSWDESEVVDEDTVAVEWWSGVAPCNVLDRVEVTTDQQTVTITLYEGSVPSPVEQVCIELAIRKRTLVDLDEPLAGRELVDGARTPAPSGR